MSAGPGPCRREGPCSTDDRPLDPQVIERTGQRLLDLRGDRGRRVVGQAMVLTGLERELGLQHELVPRVTTPRIAAAMPWPTAAS